MLDKMDDPISTPFLEMAEMQAKDKTLEGCINNGITDKEGKLWVIKDQCLFHIRTNRKSKKKTMQLVILTCLREEIMKTHHDNILGGHCGYLKMVLVAENEKGCKRMGTNLYSLSDPFKKLWTKDWKIGSDNSSIPFSNTRNGYINIIT
jgi:hypothetical protein